MIYLSTKFSVKENVVLQKYAGSEFELLTKIEGDSYVLSESGEYSYNDCFETTEIEFFAQQKYERVVPYRIIKFYQYYLMNTQEDVDVWYRGRRDRNGNWEYSCFSDSLEEAFECL